MLPTYITDRISKGFCEDDCWEWQGNLTGNDKRAYVWWEGSTRIASRVIWKLLNGDYPDCCVLHTCDNPACVNPQHLYLGTQKDNARDRQVRGRNNAFKNGFKGEANGASKLTELQVKEILKDQRTHATIAVNYGVSRQQISDIKAGKRWAYLQEGGGRG